MGCEVSEGDNKEGAATAEAEEKVEEEDGAAVTCPRVHCCTHLHKTCPTLTPCTASLPITDTRKAGRRSAVILAAKEDGSNDEEEQGESEDIEEEEREQAAISVVTDGSVTDGSAIHCNK